MDVLLGFVLVALVVWAAIAYARRRGRGAGAGTRPRPAASPAAQEPPPGSHPVTRSRERIAEPLAPDPIPFARPGMSGPLFSYGGAGGGTALDGSYAMVDVETTGFSPHQGDRIIVTAGELRELRNAATVLGVPDYFDDLHPSSVASPNGDGAWSTAATAAPPAEPDPVGAQRASRQRRCGHCRQPGHYRTTCPELVSG